MAAEPQLTPMMAQYRRIKSELPREALLLFRLGDFYEMFFEDAQTGAQILNVALTRRGAVPMCGIPYHAAAGYIGKLLKAGRKVAVCDQVEDARKGHLVKREVTQILSPGAHFDEHMLTAEKNNFLAAVCASGSRMGVALVDLTTGDFLVTEVEGAAGLMTELQRLRPVEIVYPADNNTLRMALGSATESPTSSSPERIAEYGWSLAPYEDWVFAPETAVFTLKEHFRLATLDGVGLRDRNAAIGAAGAVLHYVVEHLRRQPANLVRLTFYQRSDFLILDHSTLRHLEVLEPLHRDAPRTACLYGALNRTVTPMGARRLRDWLSQPLADRAGILRRQDAIEALVECGASTERLRSLLREVRDLERTTGRLSAGTGNARDLVALRQALEQIPSIRETIRSVPRPAHAGAMRETPPLPLPENAVPLAGEQEPRAVDLLEQMESEATELPELADLVRRAIVDTPPPALREGGLIRDGYDPALDELRAATREGKDWIARLQQDEIASTGIQSLKVRFNSVFGYYIEVTRANLDKVPAHYIRKQTIANGERFITPELKEMEGKILGAEERAVKLEYELFQRVREKVLESIVPLQGTAAALAQLDVLCALAETARLHGYCRPEIAEEGCLLIRDGRHPVLEQNLAQERFVPNDTGLDVESRIALITGPNMAGKSTYIRQVALLALLAHTGSFIPARNARVDLIDRIFTRIGASDDLARGQSTFMVEMCETSEILNNATDRSLVILDEIGRGTSTFDGLSLAWSILEYLHNAVGAKTLFATHYHELTELAARLPRIKNYNVAVREWHDSIVFLRKIVEGGTDKSYGIQVARLAGVPKPVLDRAKEILRNLEESELTPEGNVRQVTRRERDRDRLKQLGPPPQLDLFGG
jgi:DNA mismatch repair protein MutS